VLEKAFDFQWILLPGSSDFRRYGGKFLVKNYKLVQKEIVEDVPKSFRTGRLERKLQMVQLSATRRSFIAIL
jgi:hypothetical protein